MLSREVHRSLQLQKKSVSSETGFCLTVETAFAGDLPALQTPPLFLNQHLFFFRRSYGQMGGCVKREKLGQPVDSS